MMRNEVKKKEIKFWQDEKRHSQPTLDAKDFFKQEIIPFWQNNVFNTQFTTKTVDLKLDLMANPFLDKQLLNWQQNAPFQHKIM